MTLRLWWLHSPERLRRFQSAMIGHASASDRSKSFRNVAASRKPDLAEVVKAWDSLPEPVRAGILAMVKASAQ